MKNLLHADAHVGCPIVDGVDGLTLVVQTFADGRWPSEVPLTVYFTIDLPMPGPRPSESVQVDVRIRGIIRVPGPWKPPGQNRFLLLAEVQRVGWIGGQDQHHISHGFCYMVYTPAEKKGMAYFQDHDPLDTPLLRAILSADPHAFTELRETAATA